MGAQAGKAASLVAEITMLLSTGDKLHGVTPDLHGLVEGAGGQQVLCWVQEEDGSVSCRDVSLLGYVMEKMHADFMHAIP